jgi:invasion protein IalB
MFVLRSGAAMARVPGLSGSSWRVGIAAALTVASMGAAFAEVRTVGTSTAPPAATDWQSAPPMRLGVTDAPPRRSELARQQTPQNNCRKWRRIAERLGETFAGLRLRQSVVDRACLFAATELASVTGGTSGAESSFDHLWAWPWADGAIDPALPPRLHSTHGDWTIRCGQAGRRERCALIHETIAVRAVEVASIEPDLTASAATGIPPSAGTPPAKVITHFVIDTIGGHTHVVWRVFVERGEADNGSERSRTELVRFSSGTMAGAKRFDACSSVGCLMEADMTTSARLATRLWEGSNAELTFSPTAGGTMAASVPARGVRAGLAELARLKRSEDKVLARN